MSRRPPMWMLHPVKEETLDGIKNNFLGKARQRFEAGDQTVIMECMFLCMWLEIEPPRLAQRRLLRQGWGSYKI
jgi:hypothetical protein